MRNRLDIARQVSSYLKHAGQTPAAEVQKTLSFPQSYSAMLGVVLVGFGALMGLLAFIRYKKVERQIDNDSYQPSVILELLLVISILAIAVFLVLYLIHSV